MEKTVHKTLIVEDEFIVANRLRLLLEQSGHHVTGIAGSVAAAEESLRKQRPDLVLLDIGLEGKRSGIELARKLQDEDIAFIYLSANSSLKVLEEAKATEPYGFLVKPFREKDLLIAIDIACYRHKHTLESKLRQEELLKKQLLQIGNEALDAKQKFLKIARSLQSQIPFDLIVSGPWPSIAEHCNDMAYSRVGFNEYQYIGEQELINITGLKKDAFSLKIGKSEKSQKVGEGNAKPRADNPEVSPLEKVFLERFNVASSLRIEFELSDGYLVHYFFYSRKSDAYTQNHLSLLERLKVRLAEVTENIIYPASTVSMPARDSTIPPSRSQTENGDFSIFKSIVGKHPLLLNVLDLTAQVAPYSTSVLILGESGTGKERIAHSIHSLSPLKKGPFIKVNCAAIPSTLVESELFGHEKGAFTGAVEKRIGRFEQADGGTIFLDEIGELPLDMQVKLLRVLQEREIEPVGGNGARKINVRIVAATNRNLEKEIADGNFRLDLYYRLNVFPITLPPLKERKSDIEELTIFFAKKYCDEFGKPFTGISDSMIEEMLTYNWPGNIRELENVVEQSAVLNDGHSKLELRRGLLTRDAQSAGQPTIETLQDVKRVQEKTEREYIISILKKSNGRIRGDKGAAALLNIKPTTLESKLAKLGINREDF